MVAPVGSRSDSQLIARAVRDLVRRTRFPVAFGGLARDDAIHVSAIAGARTRSLDGLIVHAGRGLGGRAFVERRPRLALDYRSARGITHDYDGPVLGEGIATLIAVPIVVGERARAVVYCGSWSAAPIGDSVAAPAFRIADEIATELRVQDEVDRRLRAAAPVAEASTPLTTAARETLRESYAELRSIAATVQDAGVRERLERLERRLAALSSDRDASLELEVRLSPREIDVLACAALGSTNAEIGAALGLKDATVKSYLQSAMAKLDVSTRHAAVLKARRAGLLP
ncbi:LuxR C-terminal-related transcriptional regulator [Microbacterium sp. B2969]|uniref:LuxR C-terminal-related transcriptional regulator n=1 Tax=Microbacterium alkaliflavum TaxID=3248839 RepID=A0ABW7Q5N4_9MICO